MARQGNHYAEIVEAEAKNKSSMSEVLLSASIFTGVAVFVVFVVLGLVRWSFGVLAQQVTLAVILFLAMAFGCAWVGVSFYHMGASNFAKMFTAFQAADDMGEIQRLKAMGEGFRAERAALDTERKYVEVRGDGDDGGLGALTGAPMLTEAVYREEDY